MSPRVVGVVASAVGAADHDDHGRRGGPAGLGVDRCSIRLGGFDAASAMAQPERAAERDLGFAPARDGVSPSRRD